MVWILVFFTSSGESIQIGAYDTFNDCYEIGYYMTLDLDQSKDMPPYVMCIPPESE